MPMFARIVSATSFLALSAITASGQVESAHPMMMRFPDVSASQVVFVYGNDLWLAPRTGGLASPLASPAGMESFPRFSSDGKTIAFVGNYDGNTDLYTISADGGVPTRVTFHPAAETLCDWTSDGKLIFFFNGLSGLQRQQQLWTINATGGMPERLPVPYGANGAISPDGAMLAYTPHTIDGRTWKRYRGGMQTDLWLYNLGDASAKRITDWEGTDSQPMWSPDGKAIYYMSDNGPEHRLNIWKYDPASGVRSQVTTFSDYDIKWPAMGPGETGAGEIIFQHSSGIQLLDLKTAQTRTVLIQIPGARPTLREREVDASEFITAWDISPSGKRAVVEARGDIWSLPAENGSARNLTRTSGTAERDPAWSPDGKQIAYFTDASGEYEVVVRSADGQGEAKVVLCPSQAFKFAPNWSPDSKKLLFQDKTGAIFLHTFAADGADAAGTTEQIDKDPWADSLAHVSWTGDSRYIAYDRSDDNQQWRSIWIYDTHDKTRKRVTAPAFAANLPVFDRKGEYMYFRSNRAFNPVYADLDTTFIYSATEVLLAIPLRADMKSPWAPKSDEEGDATNEKKDGTDGDAEKNDSDATTNDPVSGTWVGALKIPDGNEISFTLELKRNEDNSVTGSATSAMGGTATLSGQWDPASKMLTITATDQENTVWTASMSIDGDALTGTATTAGVTHSLSAKREPAKGEEKGDGKDDKKKKDKAPDPVKIDLDGMEARALQLPVPKGSFGQLAVNDKNQLLYVRQAPPGSEGPGKICLFDLKDEKKEEKTVASGVGGFVMSANGTKILTFSGDGASIQDAAADAKSKKVPTAGMTAQIDPRAEWRQMFMDAWRIQRDFFYVENMHNVDWAGVRAQYEAMLPDCVTRDDLSHIIREMISELNVGHAYYQGGDVEQGPSTKTGMLGCDYELVTEGGVSAYRISRIVSGAPWDSDARGPLSQPGVNVKAGDFLLAVNGTPVDGSRAPWAALAGQVGRPVTITVSERMTRDESARDVVVEPLSDEVNLRYRDWIEQKRRHVDEATGGKVGYIYVPNTGVDGQNDLVRQFFGQYNKEALIIDDRWNGGGQIPTRFIELLNRPATNFWARRDGKDWAWPPDSHFGPKCMLINGLAGSGGDMFPGLFKQNRLGALIGTRTWGGLVGISGNPGLIDGGSVTVPTFGYYQLDGTWGIEGHGVDPDIEVLDDPSLMQNGGDPQLDMAVSHMLKEIEVRGFKAPSRPASPDRRGMGIPEADK